jgi:hypothetical protein
MSAMNPPVAIGTYTTDDSLDADLGKLYDTLDGFYRYVKTSTAIISNAGGKALTFAVTLGVPTWTVAETTTVSDAYVAGVVPISAATTGPAIAATTALAAGSRFMIKVSGAAVVRANTTVVSPAALNTSATAGMAQSMTTGVEAAAALAGFFGFATNTVAATAASGTITCVLRGIV